MAHIDVYLNRGVKDVIEDLETELYIGGKNG